MSELASTRVVEDLRATPSAGQATRPSTPRINEPSPEDTSVFQRPSRTLILQRQAEPVTELEEYFDGFVTEIADSEIRLRTRSSTGEEAEAWLPKEQIPQDEMQYLELGVPVRVSVLVRTKPRRERGFLIRFLRPHQWYRPTPEDSALATDHLLAAMKRALGQ